MARAWGSCRCSAASLASPRPNALRDTELIRFSSESFHALIDRYPQALKTLTRTLIQKSIVAPHASGQRRAGTRYLTLVPTGPSAPATAFARALTEQLSRFGPTLYLDAQELSTLGVLRDVARLPDGHPQWLRFSSWMEEEGPRHPYVVIEADATLTPWTRRAVRLADHIVLVADATATPEPGPIEVGLLAAHDHDRVRARHSRVLDHPQETRLPRGTQAWLSTRQLDSYHHVRMGDLEDLARVARILSGRAVGLTLGGGGARGYAHIGVAAALRELRIHIDMVGGTSMGSVIAGQVALGLSREEMIDLNPHFLSRKPFAQYTVPMVALLNAGRLQEGMQVAVGNTRIEDLWINYFAVSANLTTTEMVVHDRGPVWEAVRASVSLPGILPPFARGLYLLVDGGVINNLPGGVMRQRGAGSVIAVNVSAANDLRFPPSGLPTEWRIFWNKVLPFARPVPGLAAIVTRTLLLASAHRAALASRTRCRSRAQAAPGRLRPLGVREDPRHRGGRVSLHTRGRLPVERAAGSGMMLIHRERAVDPSCVLARLLRRRRGQDASDRGAGRNHRIEGRPNTGLEWDSRKHMRASYGTRAS